MTWQQPKAVTPEAYLQSKRPTRMRVRVADTLQLELREPWATADSVGGIAKLPRRWLSTAIARADIASAELRGNRLVVTRHDGTRVELKSATMTSAAVVGRHEVGGRTAVAYAAADLTEWRVQRPSAEWTVAGLLAGGLLAVATYVIISSACGPQSWVCGDGN
jgi:hypothetical protein